MANGEILVVAAAPRKGLPTQAAVSVVIEPEATLSIDGSGLLSERCC